jgi:hypothetical protein
MADANGPYDWQERLHRLDHIVSGLVTHAEMTDKRIDALREAQQQTNDSVLNLVGAIRDVMDRIPPASLR